MPKPYNVFIVYARKDAEFLEELRGHLRPMERAGMLKIWCDREIDSGVKWEDAILRNMDTADIILLMVSAAYYDSSYMHEKELEYALIRHEKGEATVIPIIVRPCDFDTDPIASSIQSLPKDAKAVTEWSNRDKVWLDVVQGIKKEVENRDKGMKPPKSKSDITEQETLKESPINKPEKPQVPEPDRHKYDADDPSKLKTMILIQGGTFDMGSKNGNPDEKPVHRVTLSDFYLGRCPVTVAEFRAFVNDSGYKTEAEKGDGSFIFKPGIWKKKAGIHWRHNSEGEAAHDDHPVVHVSWNDANAYCDWLSQKSGRGYRLPTESEWEYAARGGRRDPGYEYSGSHNLNEVGWFDANSGEKTHAVGKKWPNDLVLFDMSGNVCEWCSDWYGKYPSGAQTNPTGPSSGSYRVVRGGSYVYPASYCRVSTRGSSNPDYRNHEFGFRLAISSRIPHREQTPNVYISANNWLKLVVIIFLLICNFLLFRKIVEPVNTDTLIDYALVDVEGGTFIMGSPPNEVQRHDDECQHQVTVNSFRIGKYEVTQKQWKSVMGSTPSESKGCDDCPVENVSWNDVQQFIKKLNEKSSIKYRLPTEEEWEFAARGGTQSRGYVYSGGNTPDNVGWYYGNSGSKTHRVGAKSPNELGIHDMSGNVCEWCQDWYKPFPGCSGTDRTGVLRVYRGGSWLSDARSCRASNRGNGGPDDRGNYLGFRLAASAPR